MQGTRLRLCMLACCDVLRSISKVCWEREVGGLKEGVAIPSREAELNTRLSPTPTHQRCFWVHVGVVAAFVAVLWLLSAANLSERYVNLSSARLEVSWIAALGHTLQHGQLSGRDFHYTYGLLSQALVWLSWRLSNAPSAVAALPYTLLVFRATALVLLASIVLLTTSRYGTKWLVVALLLIGTSNAFIETSPFGVLFSYRSLAVLFGMLLFHRAQQTCILRDVLLRSYLVGVWALACQLLSADSGVYMVAGAMTVTALGVGRCLVASNLEGRQSRRQSIVRSVAALVSLLISWVAGNILITTTYWVTASYRGGVLDYLLYTLELIRGYSLSMGAPWHSEIDVWQVVALVIAFITLVGVAWSASVYPSDKAAAWPMFVVAAALPFLRHITLRSDLSHIVAGLVPMLVALSLVGGWLRGRRAQILWACSAVIGVTAFPLTNLETTLKALKTIPSTFVDLQVLSSRLAYPQDALELGQACIREGCPLVLNFPSENYISIVNHWEMLAPVVLAHNAHTPKLQAYFVQRLSENADRLRVTYALDGVATGAIDSVQHITRVPTIFEYLYRHYTLASERAFGRGIYLLTLRQKQLEFESTTVLPTWILPWDGRKLQFGTRQTAECALLRLRMQVDYPVYAFAGRPNRLVLQLFDEAGVVVHRSGVVALDAGKPFTTYVSLMPAEKFYLVFRLPNAVLPKQRWKSAVLETADTGLLGVSPAKVVVTNVECIRG